MAMVVKGRICKQFDIAYCGGLERVGWSHETMIR